jgi:hypothetical protein
MAATVDPKDPPRAIRARFSPDAWVAVLVFLTHAALAELWVDLSLVVSTASAFMPGHVVDEARLLPTPLTAYHRFIHPIFMHLPIRTIVIRAPAEVINVLKGTK